MLKVNSRTLPVLDQQPRNIQSSKGSIGIGQIDHFSDFFGKFDWRGVLVVSHERNYTAALPMVTGSALGSYLEIRKPAEGGQACEHRTSKNHRGS